MALADVATLAADASFNAKIKAQVARSAVVFPSRHLHLVS